MGRDTRRPEDPPRSAAPVTPAPAEAYRVAVEETLQGVLLFQAGRIVYVNPAVGRLTGFSREELLAASPQALEDLLVPASREREWARFEALRRGTREPVRTQLRFRRKDGEIRWVEATARNIDYGERPALLFSFVDITERLQAEQALRESEERFAQAFLASPTPALIASLETGRVVDANEALERITGYPRADLLGRPVPELGLFAGPEQAREMLALLREGRALRGFETTYTQASGQPGVALLYAERIVLGGEPCAIWQGLDVTEAKRAEAERRRLAEQVMRARRLEGLGVLAGGVAHDFNNLLVAIRGNAELALLHLGADHPARELLGDLDRAAGRAAELTRSLLTYAGAGRVETAPVELCELVRETLRILRNRLPAHLRVELPGSPEGLWIQGDATQIGQVAMNLVTNAGEALEDPAGEVRVRLATEVLDREAIGACLLSDAVEPGRYAVLEVADTGRGMDAETLDRIFDPFYTTKFRGRGLGLAGVLGAVRSHGGTLRVTSAPGQGTTFRIFLPLREAEARQSEAGEPAAHPPRRRATVLVVDDEAGVRAVARRMLEARGFAVVTAGGGVEAVEHLEHMREELDAVLLDVSMPSMTGEETFLALRRIRSDLPVVFMSGHGPEDAALRFEARGLVRHLAKPFRTQALEECLHEVLEEAEKRNGERGH